MFLYLCLLGFQIVSHCATDPINLRLSLRKVSTGHFHIVGLKPETIFNHPVIGIISAELQRVGGSCSSGDPL